MFNWARSNIFRKICKYEKSDCGKWSCANCKDFYRYRAIKCMSLGDIGSAIEAYKTSARLGDLDARMELAILYKEGKYVRVNLEEALHWARMAYLQIWLNERRTFWETIEYVTSTYWEIVKRLDQKKELEALGHQLAEKIVIHFPPRKISTSSDPALQITNNGNKVAHSRTQYSINYNHDSQNQEKSQANWPIRKPIPNLALDDSLKNQQLSLKNYGLFIQKYWIRLQNKYPDLKVDDFCAEILIQRSYFYKIIRAERSPSRNLAILLCIGLQLSINEAQDLLMLLGERLNSQIKRDFILIFGIENELSADQIDYLLNEHKVIPLLSNSTSSYFYN